MGRLMLNVLLSFAQFEREVTGERIRDKIAASKAKGMWMGGVPPLGYDVVDRKLVVNEAEAEIIRLIYRRYRDTRSPMQVVHDLEKLRIRAKTWTSTRSGFTHQGRKIDLVGVWRILRNPVYRGCIRHKTIVYPGQHEAIIPPDEWEHVQEMAQDGTPVRIPSNRKSMPPLLRGIAKCGCCRLAMTPTYTSKAKNGQRYRYYFCQAKMRGRNPECTVRNVSAATLESAVREKLLQLLAQPEILVQTLGLTANIVPEREVIDAFKNLAEVWDELFPVEQVRLIRLMVKEVLVFPDGIDIRFYREGLTTLQQELKEAA
jgi:site-specific DNA recombinase